MGIASRGQVNYQRAKLQTIKDTGQQAIQVAFAAAHMTMSPEVDRFTQMYAQELQHVRSAAIYAGTLDEEDADETDDSATVSILWLHQSGSLKRLTDIVQKAATAAAEKSQQAASDAADDAADLGAQSATSLIKQAQPQGQQSGTNVQQPNMTAAQTLAALLQMDSGSAGEQAAQQTAKAVTAGLAAGVSGMVMQQLAFQGVQTLLTDMLLGSNNAAQGAFNQAFNLTISANGTLVNGWYWQCTFDNSCTACILMDGSLHDNSETLDSHISCACLMVPYSGPPIDDMMTGDQWINAQSDAVQQAVLGPSKYLAWKSGDIQLMDLLTTREGFVEERSLKSLGLDARDYLQTLPTASERLEMQRALEMATEDLREVAPAPEWEMALPKLPEVVEPGNTRGYQIIDDGGQATARLNELTRRDLTPDEIGAMVGAQPGNVVEIKDYGIPESPAVQFRVHSQEVNPDWVPPKNPGAPGSIQHYMVEAQRVFYRDDTGLLVMENAGIENLVRGEGLGARMFGEEVQALSNMGVDRIETGASGSAAELLLDPKSPNGFYTWARFGYDTPLADLADEGLDLNKLHDAFPGVETLQGLMVQPGGPEYWRANGVSFRGTFDLKEGSLSHQILDAYLEEKGIVLEGVEGLEPLARETETGALDLTTNPEVKFISQQDIAAWTASNAADVPSTGWHYGSEDHIDRLMQNGIDVARNRIGVYGRGFYIWNGELPEASLEGDKGAEIAIHMENPFRVQWNDYSLMEKIAEEHPDWAKTPAWEDVGGGITAPKYERLFAEQIQRQGYDGVLVFRDGKVQEEVAIKAGTVRVVSDERAAVEAEKAAEGLEPLAKAAEEGVATEAAAAIESPEVTALRADRATLQTQRDAVQAKLDTLSEKWRGLVLKEAELDPEEEQAAIAKMEQQIAAVEKQQGTQMAKLEKIDGKIAKADAKIEAKLPTPSEVAPAPDIVGPAGEGAGKLTYTLPEIDQQAEQQLIQQVQDVLSGNGVASHTEAIALGGPIDDYLDQRIGALTDYGNDAIKVYTQAGDLSGDQMAWIAGYTEDHGGLTVGQALEQYHAARQQEIIRLLDQARGVGGADLSLADGAPQAIEDALRQVSQDFPTEWLDASNESGDLTLVRLGDQRGTYRSIQGGGGTIGLRYNGQTSQGELYTAAVHELGHRMEDAVPGVWEMERDFYEARTANEEITALSADLKVTGRTKKDDFANEYLGKLPVRNVRGEGLPDQYHYELLSSGLEWLLGTDWRSEWFLSKDEEYHHLILGILFGAKTGGGAA